MKNEERRTILISSFEIRNSKFVLDLARRAYRKQVLQHRFRPSRPGPLGVVAARVLLEMQVVVGPAFLDEAVAKGARVAKRLPPFPPAHVEPDARPRAGEAIDELEDRALVPPH